MIKQSDVQGRLNLFRYGIVVVTVTAFIVSFLSLIVVTAELGAASIGVGEAIMPALTVTIITGVIGVASYFGYAQVLKRTVEE